MCSPAPDPNEKRFQYSGAIYVRPIGRGVILGEAGDMNAPYIDDALSVLVDEVLGRDSYIDGSDELDATVHITVRRRT